VHARAAAAATSTAAIVGLATILSRAAAHAGVAALAGAGVLPGCSAGSLPPPVARPIAAEVLVADLLADTARVRGISSNPELRGRRGNVLPCRSRDPRCATRLSLLAAPGTAFAIRIAPPAGSILRYAVAVDSMVRGAASDGMGFVVLADGDPLAEHVVRPQGDPPASRWEECSLDLTRFGGREVELEFRANAGPTGETGGDFGGWAGLEIVRPRAVDRRKTSTRRPNILLYVVDALRADALSCLGNRRPTTPRLDAIAREGLLFSRATAAASSTASSVASLFTGFVPDRHGVLDPARGHLFGAHETLAERLAAAGVTTGAFLANPRISRARNFEQGFETFDERRDARAESLHAAVVRWAADRRSVQWFAYVHAIEPRDPYEPPGARGKDLASRAPRRTNGSAETVAAIRERRLAGRSPKGGAVSPAIRKLRALYDGEVSGWDESFGRFVESMRTEGILENTIVVVTSDHGAEFLEHGLLGDGHSIYEELIHVPVVVWGPGIVPVGRVDARVPSASLARTIAEAMGVEANPDWLGPSLLEVAAGSVAAGPILLASEMAQRPGDRTLRSVRGIVEGRWKAIGWPDDADMGAEIYDLTADPNETRNVVAGKTREEIDADPIAGPLLRKLYESIRSASEGSFLVDAEPRDDAPDEVRGDAARALGER
jgi:arylsulfatase